MVNINVGMGETQVTNSGSTILVAPGLGSCIGVALYDSRAQVGGLVHVVLPDSKSSTKEVSLLGKYADTAIPDILARLVKAGASKNNLIVKMSGGAQMFNLEKGGNILNIGMRNVIAVKAALASEGLILRASDTGGNKGRTMKLEISSGKVFVRSIGQQEFEL